MLTPFLKIRFFYFLYGSMVSIVLPRYSIRRLVALGSVYVARASAANLQRTALQHEEGGCGVHDAAASQPEPSLLYVSSASMACMDMQAITAKQRADSSGPFFFLFCFYFFFWRNPRALGSARTRQSVSLTRLDSGVGLRAAESITKSKEMKL